ncbi:TVP38/TMEM64 family protein [Helcobacillus massiliensis]|uniref:TVP38/TMEM64 family membrane protein n=1 Tax=Helcobacillus massiliensis TaxID=521392 RepID=A0A839QQD8_9MICO|nr:TVP38/TMEM64 family protein [Helcobacillus massiliensis]MCG7426354.1 TVP38/TMEM64 family protein [Helcobacillus sp. ACRRO]MBB3022713.1 putative membrane protein YdjX (TVP38/TMEM64 family) [Helcobacillus massiliensis]MCT1558305.1 TVP38/TMEM64 family protein [Helcobacillus massiliensis]MCT2037267.1 TVP38/TMEM64 family protein [Helcobacillus massiliensis]MCT2332050.1 TVP38/TMEM64 family protein [Helcobacillus massiliensis]
MSHAAETAAGGPAELTRAQQSVKEHSAAIRWASRILPLIGLAVCAGFVIAGLKSGVLSSQDDLRAFIDSLGFWGPLVFGFASFASVVFPIVPGGLLVLAAPVLFGPVTGTIINWVAVCAGSLLNFIIARHIGLALIETLFSEKLVEKYLGWTRHRNFARAFAIAIVLPVAPDDLLCYLAGTTKMRFSAYAIIILLGKIPTLLAYGLGISALLATVVPW